LKKDECVCALEKKIKKKIKNKKCKILLTTDSGSFSVVVDLFAIKKVSKYIRLPVLFEVVGRLLDRLPGLEVFEKPKVTDTKKSIVSVVDQK
jgi:hypothetical protein